MSSGFDFSLETGNMALSATISEDLKAAMKARDEGRTGALRLIRAELLKGEKETGQPLDAQAEIKVLQRMLKQRQESIEQFETHGRAEMAARERAEADVIQFYLPQGLTDGQIDTAINEVLACHPDAGPRKMGALMGEIMGKLKATGKPFDAKAVNAKVKARLG
jgi:uncharacterized protein